MKSVHVELEGVCSKEFDLETDLKTISINPEDRDEDLTRQFLFIYTFGIKKELLALQEEKADFCISFLYR